MLAQQITVLARDLSQQCTVGHGHGMAKAKGSTAVGEAKGILKTKRMEDVSVSYWTSVVRPEMEHKLSDHFELGDVLGTGGFGSVHAGKRKANGETVAVKIIPKSKVYGWTKAKAGLGLIPTEVAMMCKVNHKYVIHMLDFFEEADHVCIVMERPEKYIDLFDYITQKGTISEQSARYLFRQIVEALKHCFSVGVFHRDVKDENVLIDLKTQQVKLIDFGSATTLKFEAYTEYEGTHVYCPPEWIIRHRYHAVPATVWSLGILLYDMLQGDIPFEEEREIIERDLCFPTCISKEAESLICWMLSFSPVCRPTLDQVTQHLWMVDQSKLSPPRSRFVNQLQRIPPDSRGLKLKKKAEQDGCGIYYRTPLNIPSLTGRRAQFNLKN